ncbi:CHAT domain-containing protein [Nostoc sp.]|uniref:CHAT domain-containing protein n=1 Tax=Nostoc sp. TaxID=1180 RepID=UPI002FF6B24B
MSNYAQAIKAYDEAINCATQIKKLYYYCWRPFNNRGWALFKCSGYTAAILNWNKALRDYLQPDKALHKEGCGVIHHSKGKAHYIYGSQQNNPLSYWREAKKSYESALASLTFGLFPEQHLEVLQDLIRVCRNLGQNQVASELLHTGSDLLERLLQEITFNDKKIQLAQRFASFNQLRVDELAESGNLQEQIQALQLAEERKNICLFWLRDGWTDKASCSLKYEDIQHLLDDQTVIVYWHISPAAISTFILKHNHPPIVLSAKAKSSNFAYPAKIKQLQEFETWMSAWKNDYQNYRQQCLRKDNVRSFKTKAKWFKEMPMRLKQLSEILNVEAIIPYISNITNLILIPHRDLHLLPIHACFPEELTVVYLPSAQIGLNLQHLTTNENNSIFSIDNPRSDLNFAIIESTIVSLLYPGSEKFKTQLATRESVIHGLNQQLSCFHFAGHAYHNSNYPKKSALELANREVLTLEDLFTIELCGCSLVCLSACETGLTSKHDLLDEYVGLVSGFLAAGTSRVISTLWAIHSEAAALLMIDFHLRRQMGKSEPYALAEAVRWLKNVTVKELSIWYKHILSKLPDNELSIRPFLETELDKLSLKKGDDKLYEHPYYWAAFTVTGRTC